MFCHLFSVFSYSIKCGLTQLFSQSTFFPWTIPSTSLVWIRVFMSIIHKYIIPSWVLLSVLLNCENNYLRLNISMTPKHSISIIKPKISVPQSCLSSSFSLVYDLHRFHACKGFEQLWYPRVLNHLSFQSFNSFQFFLWKFSWIYPLTSLYTPPPWSHCLS